MSPRPDPAPAPHQLDPVDGLAQLSFVITGLLERRAAEHDLSIAATRLLGVLRDREPTMNELARLLDLDKSSVTGLVDRAQRRGLVERAPSPADGRAVLVRLTDEGRSLVSSAATLFGADVTAMLARLAPRDRTALSRLVSRLLVAHAAEHGIDLFATAAPRRGLAACEDVEVGLGQGGRVLQRDVVTGRGDDGAADVAGHVRELFGYFVPEIGLRADS